MKKASDIKAYLESNGIDTDSIKVRHGRWIDTTSIKLKDGVKPIKLKNMLPRLAEFIGTDSIRFTRGRTRIILEIARDFHPIDESEIKIKISEPGLLLGLTRDDKALIIDIRYGGLLVVGDKGTGKTTLLNQCRARLHGEFEIIEANAENLRRLAEQSKCKERLEHETVLIADDYDRFEESSLRDLIYIGLKGHLIGIYVIASTAHFHKMTGLIESTFRNIVSLRITSRDDIWETLLPLDASSLTVPGDGIYGSNTTDLTRFHTTKNNIMTIHEKEDALFAEWMEHQRKLTGFDIDNLFCPDGLHYTGKPVKRDGKHFIIDRNYMEEYLWGQSNRLVFISKDHNLRGDEEGVDVRDESGLDNVSGRIEPHFFRRYLILNYCLGKINLETGDAPSIEEAAANCHEYFLSCAVVRMNVKKIAGDSKCPKALLQEFLKMDEDFVKRQLNLYDGKIFVCLDGSEKSSIMKMFRDMFPDLNKFEAGEEYSFIYSSESAGIVVIYEWHPGCRETDENYFSAVRQLSMFIKSYPDFFKR